MNGGSPLPDSPYKGLASFDDSELDERFFFGRDRETEIVASNLVASRLTVLYGPSGVGKSSLLRAGVVRRLRALVPAGGGAATETARCRSSSTSGATTRSAAIATAAGAPRAGVAARSSRTCSRSGRRRSGGEIYLVLDQMEEYFVYHGRDARRPAPGGARRDPDPADAARARSARHPRRRARGARRLQGASAGAVRQRAPARPPRRRCRSRRDRRAARRARGDGRPARRGRGRRSSRPSSTRSRRAGSNGVSPAAASSKAAARRGRVEAPYLQLVMERIWEVERAARLVRPARGDAGRARRRGADRPAAPRAGARESRRAGAGARRAALPSAGDAVGDEDRARRRRPEPVCRRVSRAARGRPPRALGRACRPGAPCEERRRPALRDLPRRPGRRRARLGCAARGGAGAGRGARGGAAAASGGWRRSSCSAPSALR